MTALAEVGKAVTATAKRKVSLDFAEKFGITPENIVEKFKECCLPDGSAVSNAKIEAFMARCINEGLDPFRKEIVFIPGKSGTVGAYVSVDGWIKRLKDIALNGMEFEEVVTGGNLVAMTCRLHIRGMDKPLAVTEYLVECQQKGRDGQLTSPWKNSPRRMLRHRALAQAVRYALGSSTPADYESEDARAESARWADASVSDQAALPSPAKALEQSPRTEAKAIARSARTGRRSDQGMEQAKANTAKLVRDARDQTRKNWLEDVPAEFNELVVYEMNGRRPDDLLEIDDAAWEIFKRNVSKAIDDHLARAEAEGGQRHAEDAQVEAFAGAEA